MQVDHRFLWGHDKLGLISTALHRKDAQHDATTFIESDHGLDDIRTGLWVYDSMARRHNTDSWRITSANYWIPNTCKL